MQAEQALGKLWSRIMLVEASQIDNVGVLRLANPPVNALGAALRLALQQAVTTCLDDPQIAAIVLCGTDRAFSGGADITEFGKPPIEPILPDLLSFIEASQKPLVALIEGFALGGGLELALACSARVAGPGASFALPETKLGLIPGAGGTQRLPRLIGMKAAADLITSGERIDAKAARELGIIDLLASSDPLNEAVALAKTISPTSASDEIAAFDEDLDADAYRAALVSKLRGRSAPVVAFDAIMASTRMPLERRVGL